MVDRAAHFFTPMMVTALEAMRRGSLEWSPTGWHSTLGIDGTWNSHTIGYLAQREFCAIVDKRADITRYGSDQFLRFGDLYA